MKEEKKKQKKIKAWIIGDGRWDTNQMLIYQTRRAAEERVLAGGMATEWRVYPCVIITNGRIYFRSLIKQNYYEKHIK